MTQSGSGTGTPGGEAMARAVFEVFPSEEAVEGAGVRIRRVIGTNRLPALDPFLLLDEIHSDEPEAYIAGFPPHPHRGLETVTYMLAGSMSHRDSTGGEGLIGSGDVQWMTAGRGIIHSEMPAQANGLMWGFQLWLNLPSGEKLRKAEYQELKATEIPYVRVGTSTIRVISGEFESRRGPAPARAIDPLIIDVHMQCEEQVRIPIPEAYASFAYVYSGAARFGAGRTKVLSKECVVFSNPDRLTIEGTSGTRVLVCAAKPLREPVARYGPFVMNTQDELRQAFRDFECGTFVDA